MHEGEEVMRKTKKFADVTGKNRNMDNSLTLLTHQGKEEYKQWRETCDLHNIKNYEQILGIGCKARPKTSKTIPRKKKRH